MSISVKVNGSYTSGITWVSMSPLVSSLKYRQHEIDGADYDVYHVTGKNSPTCTLVGVYARSSSLDATMRSLPGSTLTVYHPLDGTVSDLVCLSCTPAVSQGGCFVTVSLTLVQT